MISHTCSERCELEGSGEKKAAPMINTPCAFQALCNCGINRKWSYQPKGSWKGNVLCRWNMTKESEKYDARNWARRRREIKMKHEEENAFESSG
ncbi:hypothetical protein NDU88_010149 [Pleurodeles waltl]|uniref:Uncharacterized protein n=1 Tax=Pleurodeles waltl TaxID=8319 RepID=A0AAV7QTK5_PLEWA|nr:hypothetical protein NDU88_010149 [Pleurodeles waltl]